MKKMAEEKKEKKEINAEFEIVLMELDFFKYNQNKAELNGLDNEKRRTYRIFDEMLGSDWDGNWEDLQQFGKVLQELCNADIEIEVVESWSPSLDQEDSWIGDLWEQAIDQYFQEKLIEEFKQYITQIPIISRWDVKEAWDNFIVTEGKPATAFPTGEGFTNDWYLNQLDETEVK